MSDDPKPMIAIDPDGVAHQLTSEQAEALLQLARQVEVGTVETLGALVSAFGLGADSERAQVRRWLRRVLRE